MRWADTRIRDPDRWLDTFDFDFNKKMNRAPIHELGTRSLRRWPMPRSMAPERRTSRTSRWGKLLGDTAAVTALRDRLRHHAHVLKCGPRSWRTKVQTDLRTEEAPK
jgi:hypothetical protein